VIGSFCDSRPLNGGYVYSAEVKQYYIFDRNIMEKSLYGKDIRKTIILGCVNNGERFILVDINKNKIWDSSGTYALKNGNSITDRDLRNNGYITSYRIIY
jgi:hypothetical protein